MTPISRRSRGIAGPSFDLLLGALLVIALLLRSAARSRTARRARRTPPRELALLAGRRDSAFLDDVRSTTEAYAKSGGPFDAYQKKLGDRRQGDGITNWEENLAAYEAIGRGPGRGEGQPGLGGGLQGEARRRGRLEHRRSGTRSRRASNPGSDRTLVRGSPYVLLVASFSPRCGGPRPPAIEYCTSTPTRGVRAAATRPFASATRSFTSSTRLRWSSPATTSTGSSTATRCSTIARWSSIASGQPDTYRPLLREFTRRYLVQDRDLRAQAAIMADRRLLEAMLAPRGAGARPGEAAFVMADIGFFFRDARLRLRRGTRRRRTPRPPGGPARWRGGSLRPGIRIRGDGGDSR